MTDWHNCDGEIGHHLHYVIYPAPEWNGGIRSWALVLHAKPVIYLPISYCPICGERLPERGQRGDIIPQLDYHSWTDIGQEEAI